MEQESVALPLATPVAFIVFNRPQHTAVTFARIRAQRPTHLFIIADGPRPGNVADPDRVREVRALLDDVDWPCVVRREYSSDNLGCKRRVSSGLDWVFSQVDRAIVLEDDCVPTDDFFSFCEELLDRYVDDDRVAAVTGNNFQDGKQRGDGSYYFSKYPHVWGWASWRRAWRQYDREISFWPEWKDSFAWRAVHPDSVERQHWRRILDRVARGEIDTWDYQLAASMSYHGGLTATPNAHLVSNIGFGPDATHTKAPQDLAGMETAPLGPMVHPSCVEQDVDADKYTFDQHFGGAAIRQRRHPVGFMRWVAYGALHRFQRMRQPRGRAPR